jgi:hypothetical protein
MLDRLLQLSRDRSPVARRELLNAVTDLYLVEGRPSERAKDHYSDIAGRALRQIEASDRAAYAERVAAETSLPHEVAKQLANDPAPAVAAAVLEKSPVLTEADLKAVVLNQSPGHMKAIAQRNVLSEGLTATLIEKGNREVLRKVSSNEGARFSQNAVSGLLERSQGDEQILLSLVRRQHELTPSQVSQLQSVARQTGATSILRQMQSFASDRRHMEEFQIEVKQLIADLRKGLRSISDTVQLLAYQDRAFDLAQVISARADIPNVQCLKVLLDSDVSGIAAACLCMGVAPDAFKAVIKLRSARLNLGPLEIEREVETYSDLPTDVVERIVNSLKERRVA